MLFLVFVIFTRNSITNYMKIKKYKELYGFMKPHNSIRCDASDASKTLVNKNIYI